VFYSNKKIFLSYFCQSIFINGEEKSDVKMKIIFISFFVASLAIGSNGRLIGGGIGGSAGGMQTANDSETYVEIRKLTANGVCENETCYELRKINNVTRQVVAGVKYTVTGIFKTADPSAYYLLTVDIWSQPWNNFVECKN
jgi:hypothetical protein